MKKKTFLHYPEYPGGKVSFQKYISENQVYPEEALKNNIEGIVFLTAGVNDNGQVTDIRIEKGIGYGCDEEAIRLLQNMHFGEVTNRGVRLKTQKKFKIPFKIKKGKSNFEINYSLKKNNPQMVAKSENSPLVQSYSYSINWANPQVKDSQTDSPE